ncbi:MAG: hypothetical protein ACLUVC_00895 [Longibaculum sp.]
MKKHLYIFYTLLMIVVVGISIECIAINNTFGSFPWYAGIFFVGFYTFPFLFIYSIYIYRKHHFLAPFIIMSVILSIWIVILIS